MTKTTNDEEIAWLPISEDEACRLKFDGATVQVSVNDKEFDTFFSGSHYTGISVRFRVDAESIGRNSRWVDCEDLLASCLHEQGAHVMVSVDSGSYRELDAWARHPGARLTYRVDAHTIPAVAKAKEARERKKSEAPTALEVKWKAVDETEAHDLLRIGSHVQRAINGGTFHDAPLGVSYPSADVVYRVDEATAPKWRVCTPAEANDYLRGGSRVCRRYTGTPGFFILAPNDSCPKSLTGYYYQVDESTIHTVGIPALEDTPAGTNDMREMHDMATHALGLLATMALPTELLVDSKDSDIRWQECTEDEAQNLLGYCARVQRALNGGTFHDASLGVSYPLSEVKYRVASDTMPKWADCTPEDAKAYLDSGATVERNLCNGSGFHRVPAGDACATGIMSNYYRVDVRTIRTTEAPKANKGGNSSVLPGTAQGLVTPETAKHHSEVESKSVRSLLVELEIVPTLAEHLRINQPISANVIVGPEGNKALHSVRCIPIAGPPGKVYAWVSALVGWDATYTPDGTVLNLYAGNQVIGKFTVLPLSDQDVIVDNPDAGTGPHRVSVRVSVPTDAALGCMTVAESKSMVDPGVWRNNLMKSFDRSVEASDVAKKEAEYKCHKVSVELAALLVSSRKECDELRSHLNFEREHRRIDNEAATRVKDDLLKSVKYEVSLNADLKAEIDGLKSIMLNDAVITEGVVSERDELKKDLGDELAEANNRYKKLLADRERLGEELAEVIRQRNEALSEDKRCKEDLKLVSEALKLERARVAPVLTSTREKLEASVKEADALRKSLAEMIAVKDMYMSELDHLKVTSRVASDAWNAAYRKNDRY